MACYSVLLVLFFWSCRVLAQGLAGIPSCAATCANNAVFLSPCNGTDVHCLCSSNTVVQSISCCITSTCSDSDQAATLQYFNGFCQSAGVTLPDTSNGPCPSGTPSNATHLSSSTSSSTPHSSTSSSTFSKTAIIAISVLAAALILTLVGATILLTRRRSRKRRYKAYMAELPSPHVAARDRQSSRSYKHEMDTRELPPSSQGGYDPPLYPSRSHQGQGLPGRTFSPQPPQQLYPHELYGQNLSPAPQSDPPSNTMFSFQISPTEMHRVSPKTVNDAPVQIQYPTPRHASGDQDMPLRI